MTEAREVGASPSTSLKAEPGLLEPGLVCSRCIASASAWSPHELRVQGPMMPQIFAPPMQK
jgi:hypothetical protein